MKTIKSNITKLTAAGVLFGLLAYSTLLAAEAPQGGVTLRESFLQRPLLADSHSHPVPDEALDLLDHILARQTPAAIILERDDRLDAVDEILDDVARIRARTAGRYSESTHDHASVGSTG